MDSQTKKVREEATGISELRYRLSQVARIGGLVVGMTLLNGPFLRSEQEAKYAEGQVAGLIVAYVVCKSLDKREERRFITEDYDYGMRHNPKLYLLLRDRTYTE
jgi:hypothetical protein